MENSSCDHISSYKCTAGLNSFEILHGFYVSRIAKASLKRKMNPSYQPSEIETGTLFRLNMSQRRNDAIIDKDVFKNVASKNKTAHDCKCRVVTCQKYQRIHACLSCPYFGCFDGGHIHAHAKEESHPLAIDTNFGYVFCFECGDYKYDADFERIAQKQKLTAACKKGMRGIKNLGNTCYISVIILSLAHAPVFRDYLLSLKHKCKIQNISTETQVQGSDQVSALQKSKPACFVCEMSLIVQEFSSDKLEPFIPDRILHLLWLHADTFKNPGLHDAHEFFSVLLDFLHLHHQGRNEKDISSIDLSCNCIIDTIFTFSLHQQYTFKGCKHKLTHVNGSRGILLDLLSAHNDDISSMMMQRTLIDILKENHSEVAIKTCEICNEIKDCRKITTLNRLPIILTFLGQQNGSHSLVNFPEFLDMTPFMTTSSKENDKSENDLSNVSKNKFYLFAVVVFVEGFDMGVEGSPSHYTCYVRRHEMEWFYMDNEHVVQVAVETVLKAKAFMLFYHKETLEFEDKERVGL